MFNISVVQDKFYQFTELAAQVLSSPSTYMQLGAITLIYILAFYFSLQLRKRILWVHTPTETASHWIKVFV